MRLIDRFRQVLAAERGNGRTRLPDRRLAYTMTLSFTGANGVEHAPYDVTFGTDEEGAVREVFCTDGKSGSDRQSLLHDGCILMSLALQYGARISDLAQSMSELRDEGQESGPPASPFGAIARMGAVLEAELKGGAA